MKPIHCVAYISRRELAMAQVLNIGGVRALYERKKLEAAEGKPILRVCETDGLVLLRCELDDCYALMVECEADG